MQFLNFSQWSHLLRIRTCWVRGIEILPKQNKMSVFRAQNLNTRWHVQNTPHHTKKQKATENLPRSSYLVWCGVNFWPCHSRVWVGFWELLQIRDINGFSPVFKSFRETLTRVDGRVIFGASYWRMMINILQVMMIYGVIDLLS